MGMSASQAKLLTITAQMHDVELKAQNIENQKILLATQRDDEYKDYCDALDKKKIQMAMTDGVNRNYVDASFKNVAQYNEYATTQYALRDAQSNRVIVDNDVYEMYAEKGFNNDKYAFAWAMLGMEENFGWSEDGKINGFFLGIHSNQHGEFEGDGSSTNLAMTEVEQAVYDKYVTEGSLYGKVKSAYEAYEKTVEEGSSPTEQRTAYETFRNELYSSLGKEIYDYMRLDKEDPENTDIENGVFNTTFPEDYQDIKGEFDYYTRLFDEIKSAGGCVSIDKYAPEGNTDNDWFNSVVMSGKVLIDMYDKKKGWTETSVATSIQQNNLQEVSDDADVKKAEAKYEYALSVINKKDTQFDKELSKLETERSALKTEMDSVKKVKEDNVERTFGIFS